MAEEEVTEKGMTATLLAGLISEWLLPFATPTDTVILKFSSPRRAELSKNRFAITEYV